MRHAQLPELTTAELRAVVRLLEIHGADQPHTTGDEYTALQTMRMVLTIRDRAGERCPRHEGPRVLCGCRLPLEAAR